MITFEDYDDLYAKYDTLSASCVGMPLALRKSKAADGQVLR